MSEEVSVVDWTAAHDQARAEVERVMREGFPYVILWHEGDRTVVSSTGMFPEGDELQFLRALAARMANPGNWNPATDPPEGKGGA